ncbi:DUF1549 domain-containing protein [Thalassoglobus sp.]|uniref:DUF1549 domain-containing protein n=1 Tax=Thalassoglobus sp. TaxID=2795869 RepID=UPI003AA9C0D3
MISNLLQFLIVACLSVGCLLMTPASLCAAEPDDFSHKIAPILKKHCVECHGGKEAKGGFSINTRGLFLDKGYAIPKDVSGSYFLDLIHSNDPEVQMPPPKKPRVSQKEIEQLKKWVEEGMEWDAGFTFAPANYEPPLKPYSVELPPAVDGRTHPIDRILDSYLSKRELPQPKPIDDATFCRRVSLDLVGLLPTPEELEAFLHDESPDKRERYIHSLLERNIDYADHWLSFWNDLLRNDYTGTGFITGGRKQISGWLYSALVSNKPYDQFVKELIAPPTNASQGFIDGIKWRGEVSAGQTLEIQFSQSISQSFLGINMKCASCHDSFIDRWTLKEAYGLAAIYSNRELAIHRCDKPTGETAKAAWVFPELGQTDPSVTQPERLKQLSELMTHPENGRLTRTIVNRLWAQMMGRGIVHPLDAMQSEPWNADLLEVLSNFLIENNYDLKQVLALIATSQAYQSQTELLSQESLDGEYVYRGPRSKRMTAEQFLDGIWQITGTAPTSIDAPILRSNVTAEEVDQVSLQGKWIWRTAPAEEPNRVPPGGETILLSKTLELDEDVSRGVIAVTCDNEFTLFINNREASRGNNWQKVESIPVHHLLKKGKNAIIAIAKNTGATPNPAGFYLEGRLVLENGKQTTFATDESWNWNDKLPASREGRLGKVTGKWNPVQIVPTLGAWSEKTTQPIRQKLAQGADENLPMIRASLMNNDFFMSSLGRPLREQIVSSRPNELTTLEAINLTNGETLASFLKRGGEHLSQKKWDSPQELVDFLVLSAFTRPPTSEESEVMLSALSEPITPEKIEDLLWVIVMMPEFLLIR